ncbi:hypothetical protein ACFYTV_01985 [Streptomyces sp. NPDC004562]|uniref:hypothetical protein n=1 Tax=unclassified Streptomyces TaxID=2593676 RepID=UPI00367EC7C8
MRRGWALTLATVGAAVLAGGGYVVGDWTGRQGEPSCAEVRQTAEDLFGQWSKLDTDDGVRSVKVRAAADIVLVHGDCFTFATRSAARAAVQQLDASGDSIPMQIAAGLVACQAVVKDPSSCQTRP